MSDLFAILLVDTACGLERYYTTNQFCNQSEIASDSAEYAMSMPMCRKNAAKNLIQIQLDQYNDQSLVIRVNDEQLTTTQPANRRINSII